MYAKIDSHMRNAVFELPRETRNDEKKIDANDSNNMIMIQLSNMVLKNRLPVT